MFATFRFCAALCAGAVIAFAHASSADELAPGSADGLPPAGLVDGLPPVSAGDLAELSLEDLMEIEVTSVSRKAEPLVDTPAAISVLTGDEIRRSGAKSLAEALRLVPGMQVARVSANRWSVSARGFNEEFANKLLVLIDGRSVYTPLFSGVFWDVQDVMLEDVQRIEVIRGPGASVWGANAVNGVINVITKPAGETQGGLAVVGGGSDESGYGAFRFGGSPADGVNLRVWGRHFDHEGFVDATGADAGDEWNADRGGMRLDWDVAAADRLTFQGDFYRGDVGERHRMVESLVPASQVVAQEDIDVEGWNALGRWTRTISEDSDLSFQAWFDRTKRVIEFASEVRNTVDLDFQHRFSPWNGHEVIWGAGYRWSHDRTRGSLTVDFLPDSRTDDLWSAFVQDEIALLETLSLTIGSKFEHNDYTGFEIQPTARLLYQPHSEHTFWGAVSRAVRTPSRAGDDVLLNQEVTPLPGPGPISQVLRVRGSRDLGSEELTAWELGYRFVPGGNFTLDVATFLNEYDELRSVELVGIDPFSTPGAVVVENRFGNGYRGHAWGGEIAGRWRPQPWWQLTGSWSYARIDLRRRPGFNDATTEATAEGSTPSHTFHLRSGFDLPGGVELDGLFWWVENLAAQEVNSYLRVDVRLGWKVRDDVTLSVVGRNLQESRHQEFGDTLLWPPSEIERGVYGEVEWRF